jgi:hypothetical protein
MTRLPPEADIQRAAEMCLWLEGLASPIEDQAPDCFGKDLRLAQLGAWIHELRLSVDPRLRAVTGTWVADPPRWAVTMH